jgi:hypothetical protein
MTYYVGRTTWMGFATESVSGTAIATPKFYIPIKQGGGMEIDQKILSPDETRGNRAKISIIQQGVRGYKGSIEGVFYPDDALGIARAAFGKDTVTQPNSGTDPTVYDHALSVENTSPISLTIFDNTFQTTNQVEQYAFGLVDKFNLKFDIDQGQLMYKADLVAMKRALPTAAVPSTAWTPRLPFAGWTAVVTKGGSGYIDLNSFEMDISNGHEPFFGANGTQEGTTMMFGDFDVKCKFTALLSKAEYDKFVNDTEEAFQVVFTGETISNTYKHTVTLNFTRMRYTATKRDRGKKLVMMNVDCVPVLDTNLSSPSPVTMTVRTNKAATYY